MKHQKKDTIKPLDTHIRIGKIVNVHGLEGECKVEPLTDDNERFYELETVLIGHTMRALEPIRVQSVRLYKNFVFMKFDTITTREKAEALRNIGLWVDRENSITPKKGRYLICDVIGCDVYENENKIGVVKDVLKTGANDVFEVQENNGKMIYLPVIEQCVLHIDTSKRRIDVIVMEGLRDDPV